MKLRRMGRLGLGIMMLVFVVGNAIAQDEPVFSAEITLDYNSKYIWRGIQVNDESVFQPGVSGSAYGFTGSIWANIDMTDYAGTQGEFSEIDYALDYSGALGDSVVGYSVGVIHYLFPTVGATDASTTEIYGGLSFDVPLSPFITWYGDVNAIDGSYVQMGVGHSLEMEMAPDYSVGLDLGASFAFGSSGYNNGYFGVNESKWNDFTLGVGVPFNLKHVTITPALNVATFLDDTIAAAHTEGYGGDRTNVWFGVSLSKSF
ncbi:MAG: hypothetical protein P8Z37_10935 [Acidobacteriota bacterium]